MSQPGMGLAEEWGDTEWRADQSWKHLQVRFTPAHPLQGKKPREEGHKSLACSVMSAEEVHFRNRCPRGRDEEDGEPVKE